MATVYGYARCSTNEEKQDIQRQTRELEAAGAETVRWEFEHGDAATKKELDHLLNEMEAGDTLLTLEVSRLSRSTQQLCQIIEIVQKKHLKLQIVGSITIDCRSGELDPMTKAFLQMSGVFAELELSMIRARVKSGMENARAKGKQIGRPKTTSDQIPEKFLKLYPLYKTKQMNKKEFAGSCKLSRPTVDKYLKIIEGREE